MIRKTTLLTVLALLAAPLRGQAGAPAGETLSLEEAVTLALGNNRSVATAALQVERAERRLEAARTRRLPSLELQAQAGTTLTPLRISFPEGAFGDFPGSGPIPSRDTVVEAPRALSGSVNATLAQPLTQLKRIGLSARLSALQRDGERERLRQERAEVAAEVRRLYYGLLQTESALAAKQQELEVYRELERVVGQQLESEVVLPADALEVKARLAAREYELLGLKGDLQSGRERLNELLGRELEREFGLVPVPETAAEELDLALATARALEQRPDLAQARLFVEQAETDRRLKRAESIPELSLAVSYYSFVNVDLLPRNLAQVGLQLKWEPFDWGRRGKERAEKALQVAQAQSAAAQAQDRVRLEVSLRFRKLQEARLLIEAQRLSREAAAERLRVLGVRRGQETALLKDVLEAQAGLSAAQAQYDRALLTFWTAKADFHKALGQEL